jgi:uncharacterized membrane protein YkvA (DUF1232 family)
VNAKAIARLVPDCAVLLSRLLRDDRVPRRQKLLIGAVLPYLALPFDLIPDFIPVVGQLDDAFLVVVVLRRVVRKNPGLVRELWPGSPEGLALVARLGGATGEPDERSARLR